ncbi:MAG: hypothetical protein ACTHXF_08940 [Brevibacterium yomogidense]
MRRYGVLVTAGLAGLLLGACSDGEGAGDEATPSIESASEATAEPVEDEHRAIIVISSPDGFSPVADGEDCTSRGATYGDFAVAFDELSADSQVLIEDAAGTVVATAGLGLLDAGEGGCAWMVDPVALPAGGEFYTATMGAWSSEVRSESDVDEDGHLRFTLRHPSA